MQNRSVSLVEYQNSDSVKRALELCGALEKIKPGARILIKPNLVGWDNQGPYPPWGVLTTSIVIKSLCRLLAEMGAGEIIIGEGAIDCAAIGSGTDLIYKYLGYETLTDRYGARLIDFNKTPYRKVEVLKGHTLKWTTALDDCDLLINVPVLKTHAACKVSLGMKNLKGLLAGRSKIYCHHPDGLLDHFISKLPDLVPDSITLIDGIYANEQGPLHFGRAHRTNLLVASNDVYSADLLGAYLLGYGADDVEHINRWAEKRALSVNIADLDIKGGLDPSKVRRELKWDWQWNEQNTAPDAFDKAGLCGVVLPKYDNTLCTGCSYLFNPLMLVLLSSTQKQFNDYEFLSGKMMEPSEGAKKTFLFGDCQVKKNKNHSSAGEIIQIKGCPPDLDELVNILQSHGMPVSRKTYDGYRRHIMGRYLKNPDVYPQTDFYLGKIPRKALPPENAS